MEWHHYAGMVLFAVVMLVIIAALIGPKDK